MMACERVVWTQMLTGKDSDVIFSTTGHFCMIFASVHRTVTYVRLFLETLAIAVINFMHNELCTGYLS